MSGTPGDNNVVDKLKKERRAFKKELHEKRSKTDWKKVENIVTIMRNYIAKAVACNQDELVIIFRQHPKKKHKINKATIEAAIEQMRTAGYRAKTSNYYVSALRVHNIYGDRKHLFPYIFSDCDKFSTYFLHI